MRHDHQTGGRGPIDIACGATIPACPRCDGEGLMAARIPHGWERPGGRHTNGTTVVVLCPNCDADDAHAGPLITFFHVHGHITPETVHDAGDLIMLWAENLQAPRLDVTGLDSEVEAWRNDTL